MKTLHQFLLEVKGEEEPEGDREGHLGWDTDDLEFEDQDLKEDKSSVTHEELGTTVHEGPIGDADTHTAEDHAAFKKAHAVLDEHQQTAIRSYKNLSYDLNKSLRDKEFHSRMTDDDKEHFAEKAKHLDRAVGGSKLHRDMHVYRGFQGALPMEKLKPGMKFTDHGFTGTTVNHKVASQFAKIHFAKVGKDTHAVVTMAKIHLPKGTKALHLDVKGANHAHSNEAETLVHRGTTYRVTHHTFHRDDKNKRHYHIVHMTVDSQK